MMVVKLFPLLLIKITPTTASGISSPTGEIIGYTYIGITIFMLLCYALIGYSKYSSPGSLMLVSQIFIFTQFCRFSALINFEHSPFFQKMWKTYSKAQDPSEFLSCSKTSHIWVLLGFESDNFACNSFAYLCLISGLILIWLGFFALFKEKRQKILSFWVFLAYCSASDLSLSAFAQLSELSFSSTIDIAGSLLAIFYLFLIFLLLGLQCFFIYQEKHELFLVACMKEDFLLDKEYYFYYFYPLLLLRVLIHSCILVFAESKRYSAPVVVSILNLINCISYLVAYVVSIRPFTLTRHGLFVHLIQVIEIVFLFLPVFYEYSAIPDLAIDLISIFLFVVGLSLFAIRSYLDYKVMKISVTSQVHATSNLPAPVEEDLNGSSLELIKTKDNGKGFEKTFKPNDFDVKKANTRGTDARSSDDKEGDLKPIKKPRPAVFTFYDNSTPKSSENHQKGFEKTANFPVVEENLNVNANRPIHNNFTGGMSYLKPNQPFNYSFAADSHPSSSRANQIPGNSNRVQGVNNNPGGDFNPTQSSGDFNRIQPSRARFNLNEITIRSKNEY